MFQAFDLDSMALIGYGLILLTRPELRGQHYYDYTAAEFDPINPFVIDLPMYSTLSEYTSNCSFTLGTPNRIVLWNLAVDKFDEIKDVLASLVCTNLHWLEKKVAEYNYASQGSNLSDFECSLRTGTRRTLPVYKQLFEGVVEAGHKEFDAADKAVIDALIRSKPKVKRVENDLQFANMLYKGTHLYIPVGSEQIYTLIKKKHLPIGAY